MPVILLSMTVKEDRYFYSTSTEKWWSPEGKPVLFRWNKYHLIEIEEDVESNQYISCSFDKFKKQHTDELGLFRTNIAKLTQSVSKEKTFEAIRQEAEDIYKDEFLPSYNNFKKALKGSGIKWVTDNFMKISTISTVATALPMALLGLALPHALIAGAGVSLITSLVSYNEDRKDKVRVNPYPYLLAVDKHV